MVNSLNSDILRRSRRQIINILQMLISRSQRHRHSRINSFKPPNWEDSQLLLIVLRPNIQLRHFNCLLLLLTLVQVLFKRFHTPIRIGLGNREAIGQTIDVLSHLVHFLHWGVVGLHRGRLRLHIVESQLCFHTVSVFFFESVRLGFFHFAQIAVITGSFYTRGCLANALRIGWECAFIVVFCV